MGPVVYSYKISNGKAIKINPKLESTDDNGFSWFHLSGNHKKALEWIKENLNIPEVTADMLSSKNTRPNVVKFPTGYMITMRAVNTNEEGNDIFNAINLWVTENSIITSRNAKILAIEDIVKDIELEDIPESKGEFIVRLIHHIQKRINLKVRDIEYVIETLEEKVLNKDFNDVRTDLINQRKTIVQMKRYLVPQREMLQALILEKQFFIDESNTISLKYYYDKMIRLVEELDVAREHILLVQEEVTNIKNDQMNKSMFRISIISALFLPLGFITGLLGVNIGGVPGVDDTNSFLILSVISLIYLVLGTVYFIVQKKF